MSVSVIPLSNLSKSRASTISERGVKVLPGTEYAAAALSLGEKEGGDVRGNGTRTNLREA